MNLPFKNKKEPSLESFSIYQTHWSDHHQSWSSPIESENLQLGPPFGYFISNDIDQAKKFVSNLKPLIALRSKDYFPSDFYIGSFPLKVLNSTTIFSEV